MIELKAIRPSWEENAAFADNPDCATTLGVCIDYYKVIGFKPPWVCYYAYYHGELVGSGAFKGGPVNNRVEIAYGTLERFRHRGIATMICKKLVDVALQQDPGVEVSARTLMQENFSVKVLRKNGFVLAGSVQDKDDGEVWEWLLQK
jgi:RimJ/RimL family protein N-acetyltransferase